MKLDQWGRLQFRNLATSGATASLLALIGLVLYLVPPAYADGNQIPVHYFISKNGDNSDGKSWATAWNEMDQVNWPVVNAGRGDDVTIDGGTTSMVYNTPLRVQVQYMPYLFQLKVATEAGHDGTAIISGNGQNASGIELISGAIHLTGNHKGGLVVRGWGLDGVSIPQGLHTTVEYLELSHNRRSGLHISGGFNLLTRKCIMHDNRVGILVDPPSVIMSSIDRCWVYNSSYLIETDGIRVGNGGPNPSVFFSNCVVGPGLRDGYTFGGSTDFGGNVTNCLFINATRNNIATVKGLMANKVTSFMTRANPLGRAHQCLNVQAGQTNPQGVDMINNSIFYGGVVRVAPGIVYNNSNDTQFRTTGNTTFLSSTQVDPMFVSNVGAYTNLEPIRRLINTDFSLQAGSPAAGTGSDITSVAQLLSQF